MNEKSIELVRRAFRRYYFYRYNENVRDITKREFGYTTFENAMKRHLAFKNRDELRAFLVREIPADVYQSNAYYTNPSAEMDFKGWIYADLIFDIDIKDIHLPCKDSHTISICQNCKRFELSKICSHCNSSINHVNIPCSNCIDAGKDQVKRLLNILNDLGSFDTGIYFSGNNGFHVHLEDEELSTLGSEERREILDYVKGNGIIPEIFGINKRKNNTDTIKKAISIKKGWKRRVIKALFAKKNEDEIFRSLTRRRYETFKKEIEEIVGRLGATSIDPVVTIDTHRIFRLQGSLSSKSGLAKIKVDNIEDFDPFIDAVLLDDELVKVHVYTTPKFILNNNSFGPYNDVNVDMPLYAAVYLICKGLADVT